MQQNRFLVGGILKSQVTPEEARKTGLAPIRPPPGYNPFAEAQKSKPEKDKRT